MRSIRSSSWLVSQGMVVIDDDTYFNSNTSQHLGEIKLEISRVNLGRRKERTQQSHYKKFGTEDQKVHERSKKATSHRIKCMALISFLIAIIHLYSMLIG